MFPVALVFPGCSLFQCADHFLDTLTTLELERKISELQKELKKELEEKEALHNEVNLLTELKSLPSEVEILRKEVNT